MFYTAKIEKHGQDVHVKLGAKCKVCHTSIEGFTCIDTCEDAARYSAYEILINEMRDAGWKFAEEYSDYGIKKETILCPLHITSK